MSHTLAILIICVNFSAMRKCQWGFSQNSFVVVFMVVVADRVLRCVRAYEMWINALVFFFGRLSYTIHNISVAKNNICYIHLRAHWKRNEVETKLIQGKCCNIVF